MQWKINDGGITGPVDFNMRIENVKALLGEPNDSFKKTPDSDGLVLSYDSAGIHLNVNENGCFTQLTIFPANEVFLKDIQLIKQPINSIYEDLQTLAIAVTREDKGVWCEKYKIFLVDVDGIVDGVEIYSS